MKQITLALFALAAVLTVQSAHAHCQVPCGIYGDEAKFGELKQHIETIAKASAQINELAGKDDPSLLDKHQIVRWISDKEHHAQEIIDEAANYFLAQRIKPDADNYAKKVELLHHIIVNAMKAKQTIDGEAVDTLSAKLEEFEKLYNAK